MNDFKSTVEAARALNVKPQRLQRYVWDGTLDAPEKCGGSYLWSDADLNRASQHIFNRPFRKTEVASSRG